MRYIIDGYNFLFSQIRAGKDFQSQREELIEYLNERAEVLGLDVLIVFDAHCRVGDMERSHFRALEIIFTQEGEDADKYIFREVHHANSPQRITVVTSDRPLGNRCKIHGSQTLSIAAFSQQINARLKNRKERKAQKDEPTLVPKRAPKAKPTAGSVEAYESVFESKYKLMSRKETAPELKIEKAPKEEPSQEKTKKNKKSDHASDYDRWLDIFSKKAEEDF